MTYAEKIKTLKSLNWDTYESPEDMLSIIDRRQIENIGHKREALFIRCLERLKWNILIEIWDVNECIRLYTPKTRLMIFQESRRQQYDRFFAFLRKEPVSFPEWGSEYCNKIKSAFLPHGEVRH